MKNLPPLSPDLSPQAAAEFAEIRRMMRENEEARKAETADRKAEEAKRKADRKAEAAERKAEAAERKAERKAEAAERKAEREAEAAERKAEEAKRKAEDDKRAAEREAEREAEKKRAARIDEQIEANNKQIGALSDGTVLEEDIFYALDESRTICDISLDNVEHDVKSLRGDQFDIVGTNGKYVVVIEIKRTLKPDDAVRFAKKKKPVFEQEFASMIGEKKVLGAMIYRRSNEKARRAALDNGLLLVKSGDSGGRFFITRGILT